MKKTLLFALWMLLLAACSQETTLSITPDIASYTCDADGGSFDAVIFTNGSWTASCDDKAVSFTPASGDYTTPLHVSVGTNEENYTKSIRIALTSKLDDLSRSSKIVITQACRPFIFSEETFLRASAAGGTVRFHVNSNASWKVAETTCDGEAFTLSVDPRTAGPNRTEVSVTVPENTTGSERNFAVRLALESNPDTTVILVIGQDA